MTTNFFPESSDELKSKDNIALLSEYSKYAQERREKLEKDLSSKPAPQFILSVQQAEVSYTIDPLMLPYSQVDFPKFSDLLKEKYNLCFRKPSIPESLIDLSACEEIDSRHVETLMRTEQSSGCLEFTSGRFPVSRDDFVPVKSIRMTWEAVQVVVQSNSKVAEVIVKEVVESLWESTGSPKRWDNISPMVQMIGYATATKVNFGIPLNRFLSVPLSSFLDQEVANGSKYGAGMMTRSARDNFAPPPDTFVTWAVDELQLYIYVFNKKNGRYERCKLQFSVRTVDEENTGIFTFVSELPFDEHVACLEKLKSQLESSQ